MGILARRTIETVTGPIWADDVGGALAHEHLFVDFRGPDDGDKSVGPPPGTQVECERRLAEVHADGVDLLVDCTAIGIGRDVRLLRAVARSTGVRIVAATGIYKDLRPPALRHASGAALADLFIHEVTSGIADTDIRAGFVKLATTEAGPTEEETVIHRAGARAAAATGVAIVLHSPRADVAGTVLENLEEEGFDPMRLIWAHAQESTPAQNVELAARGVTVSLDAIGTSDDGDMLDRIERLADAGHGDQVVLSSDSSLVMQPPEFAYERDLTYLHRTFLPQVSARCGPEVADALARVNVVRVLSREA